MNYTGRFAPSPTGPLHFGSLLAATASYLEARIQQGRWLLRLEDLDKPREQPGASAAIIQTLVAHGFEWDAPVIHQSQRLDAYQEALQAIRAHTFPCTCTRKQLSQTAHNGAYGPLYPGTCRQRRHTSQAHAIRLRTSDQETCFDDQLQGRFCQNLERELGDFVIRRADGQFAYQLAVVVDDAWQGITHVVRGADLLDNTPRQVYLQQLLGLPAVAYTHIPVAAHADGQKLSKQTHAPPLDNGSPIKNLCSALQFLGQQPPAADAFGSVRECWDWATAHWSTSRIPACLSVACDSPTMHSTDQSVS